MIGEALLVNGQPLTITGVAPSGFEGTTLGVRPLIFVPITLRGVLSAGFEDRGGFADRRNYWAYLFARLKPDVSIEQARAAIEPLYRSILTAVETPLQAGMSDRRMAEFVDKPILILDGRRGQSLMDDETATPLLLLLAVTGIVILNRLRQLANLLLARLSGRQSEMAVRLAIGAARRHLLAQLLTESCLLALLGGAAGLVVAQWTLHGIGAFLWSGATELAALSLDPAALIFTAAVSLGTGVLFGIVPALHATRAELISALKDGAGQAAGARSAARFRRGLVMAQFALAMTLLVTAGLFIQSLRNVSRVDLGIRTDHVVTLRLSPETSGYEPGRSQSLFERVEETLAAQPGVTGITAALVPVFTGQNWANHPRVRPADGARGERDAPPRAGARPSRADDARRRCGRARRSVRRRPHGAVAALRDRWSDTRGGRRRGGGIDGRGAGRRVLPGASGVPH